MDNHLHLTGRTASVDGLSGLFKVVNSQFAKRINQENGRSGQVVMDRFRSPVIQSDRSLMAVMRYIDLNPYRAGKVSHPRLYGWSSYCYYAYGYDDPLVTAAPSYVALGRSDVERQKAYREMVDEIIDIEGYVSRDYSYVKCIGDPMWVQRRYDELKEVARTKRISYLLRQRRVIQSYQD